MIKNHSHAIEVLSNCLPYFNQCKDIDLTKEGSIRLTWRGNRFRINYSPLMVEEVEGSVLAGSSLTILLKRMIEMSLNPSIYVPLP